MTESAQAEHFRVLDLEALVRVKLTAFGTRTGPIFAICSMWASSMPVGV